MDRLPLVQWLVVEQEHLVDIGRRNFSDQRLRFSASLEDALEEISPNLVLFASSLQYVESPSVTLELASRSTARHLVFDRTPFHSGSRDLLAVQTVPPDIYPATYLAWLFSRRKLETDLKGDWRLLVQFETLEEQMVTAQGTEIWWRGLHYCR